MRVVEPVAAADGGAVATANGCAVSGVVGASSAVKCGAADGEAA